MRVYSLFFMLLCIRGNLKTVQFNSSDRELTVSLLLLLLAEMTVVMKSSHTFRIYKLK